MPAPDTVLQGRYRIVRQLGKGGMGAVYEAVDERLSRTVALKETLAESDDLKRAFEREARLLANLRHPALPKVIDHFTEESGQFLVMEFIPGNDLGDLLERRQQPFSSDEVLRWADDLLDALHLGGDERVGGKLHIAALDIHHIPPHVTPLRNVYLANMFQVYPQDRGQNYSIAMAERLARTLSGQ